VEGGGGGALAGGTSGSAGGSESATASSFVTSLTSPPAAAEGAPGSVVLSTPEGTATAAAGTSSAGIAPAGAAAPGASGQAATAAGSAALSNAVLGSREEGLDDFWPWLKEVPPAGAGEGATGRDDRTPFWPWLQQAEPGPATLPGQGQRGDPARDADRAKGAETSPAPEAPAADVRAVDEFFAALPGAEVAPPGPSAPAPDGAHLSWAWAGFLALLCGAREPARREDKRRKFMSLPGTGGARATGG
jgi:hypothetical protein